jgi:hypothetical protein
MQCWQVRVSISLSQSLDVFLDASREHERHAFDPQFVGAFRHGYCAEMPQTPAPRVLFTELRYDAGHVVGGGGHAYLCPASMRMMM